MTRTLLIGSEEALGTNLAGGKTLDSATVVRVINLSGADATVSIEKSTSSGYSGIATVTLPDDRVEFFEKAGADIIYASSANVKGAKVGFTG